MTNIIASHDVYKTVEPFLPANPLILEAGAFLGHDSLRLANHWPLGVVHAFEPVPDLFAQLQQKTASTPSIITHQYALSEHTGTAQLYIAKKPQSPGVTTQASSLHKPTGRLERSPIIYPDTLTVNTITIDDWAAQNNVDHIDFLWLDMQGHELAALRGAQKILPTVHAIFTEVNFIDGYEGQPSCQDVITWIESQGFTEVARTFKNQTDWFFGELLFVRK